MSATEDPTSTQASDASPSGPPTGVQCLVAVARHHGVDLGVDRLMHDYAVEGGEPSTDLLLRMAREAGLGAQEASLTWDDLLTLGEALPVILRLNNDRSVILTAVREGRAVDGPGLRAIVLDPLGEGSGILALDRERLESNWGGQAILSKRRFKLTDDDQPFGLRWFVPEILKQRRLFGEVALAVLFVHLIALATPIFFQIVVDKVLANETTSTLLVITVGVVIALIFDAILGYIRSYTLLHATSRIDIRVATRTFAHLLSLPIGFFDHHAAGVLNKHMQQSSQIREFLTGKTFLAVLESTALIVFLPILFFYSPILTGVVLLFALLIAMIIALLIAPYQKRLQSLYAAEGDRQALLIENLNNIETVKALALEPRQRRIWDEKSAHAVGMHLDVGRLAALARSASGLLEKLMLIAVIGVGRPAGVRQRAFGRRADRVPNAVRARDRTARADRIAGPRVSGGRPFGPHARQHHEPARRADGRAGPYPADQGRDRLRGRNLPLRPRTRAPRWSTFRSKSPGARSWAWLDAADPARPASPV